MDNQDQDDRSFINSIVGEGTAFSGELRLNGLLRIDGDFTGAIHTDGKVLVGISGRASCTINAGTVVIGGVVKGNIVAVEKVLILSTGMMIGNIKTPRLIAEEGVVLHGTCLVGAVEPSEDLGQRPNDEAGRIGLEQLTPSGFSEAATQELYSGVAKADL